MTYFPQSSSAEGYRVASTFDTTVTGLVLAIIPVHVTDMSLSSPTRTFYNEKVRFNTGSSTAGRYRVNIQIGSEQFHVVLRLPESRTFNYIMDELQLLFKLSEYQRVNTRIYLQTILGETEILVNSRPNYGTDRNIDYIGIPANPGQLPAVQRNGGVWLCFTIILLFVGATLSTFIGVEFFLLRPRLLASVSANRTLPVPSASMAGPITASMAMPSQNQENATLPIATSIPAPALSLPSSNGVSSGGSSSSGRIMAREHD